MSSTQPPRSEERSGQTALWRARSPDGTICAELWEHPLGWECRIYRGVELERAWFHDPRDAHLMATQAVGRLDVHTAASGEHPVALPERTSTHE